MNEKNLQKQWDQAERAGLVRLRCEPEEDNYFDVYGLPTGYTNLQGQEISSAQAYEDIARSIDLYGCWCVFSEYFDGSEWQEAGSIGMCTGYTNPLDPKQNCYVPGLMQSALDALTEHQETIRQTEMAACWP